MQLRKDISVERKVRAWIYTQAHRADVEGLHAHKLFIAEEEEASWIMIFHESLDRLFEWLRLQRANEIMMFNLDWGGR